MLEMALKSRLEIGAAGRPRFCGAGFETDSRFQNRPLGGWAAQRPHFFHFFWRASFFDAAIIAASVAATKSFRLGRQLSGSASSAKSDGAGL